MLGFENVGQQPIFALEVVVKRAFSQFCHRRDLVHRHPAVALSAKQPIGRFEYAFSCRFGATRHSVFPPKYTH